MRIAPPVNAQVRPPDFKDFSGGLNVRDYWHRIKDNELTVAKNVRFDDRGVIHKRGGWTKLASAAVGTAGNLIGVTQGSWVSGGAIVRKAMATDGVKVFYLNGAVWTDITGAIVMAPAVTSIVSFVQMTNLVIGYDGTNAPWTWDGAAGTISLLGGTPPIGNISIVWQNRLWIAGVGTAQTRLYYSALGDPATWGASAFFDVPSAYDGDPITGLAVLYGNLIVFKRNSIYIVQGDDPTNFSQSKTNSTVGCVSPYSIVAVQNLIYFVSDKGLYAMNLSNVKQICYKVEPRYTNAVRNQLLSGLSRNRIQGVHYRRRNEVWIAMDATASGQDHHDRMLVHNYEIVDENGDPAACDHITAGSETAPAVLADYVDSSGNVVPIGSFYDKFVYIFSEATGTDATPGGTANFSAEITSKYFDFGDQDALKFMRWIWTNVETSGGTPKILMGKLTNNLTSETTATLTPSSPTTFYNSRQRCADILPAPQANLFKVGFISDDGGTFSLFQFGFEFVNSGRRN